MKRISKRNLAKLNSSTYSHCSFQRSIIIVKARQSFHATVVISLTFWLCGCILLLCENVAGEDEDVTDKVQCHKDRYGNNNCTCPHDPITERYVDEESDKCEFFYLCHLGVAIKMQCGQWWAFHPKLKECILRDRIPKTVCPPVVDCPIFQNKYVEDPNDCTKYYLCYAGKNFQWMCPEGQYFDPYREKCVKDRGQAEACMLSAKKVLFKRLGYDPETKIPVSSVALTEAKAFMKEKAHKKG